MKTRLTPTNFDTLQTQFPDLIRRVANGHPSGLPNRWPHIRMTIYFHDGSVMTVTETLDQTTHTIRTYQYDWEYTKDHFVKWHNEPHANKSHQTTTEPHHMHIEGMLYTSKERFPNYSHHDLTTILETIRVRNRTSPSSPALH